MSAILHPVIELLKDNPLLLLFTVMLLGYLIGRIKVAGISLGVAAVLFAALAVSSLDKELKLDEIVYRLGLAIFVYTIGLSSGTGFFRSFKKAGLRDNLFVVCLILLAAGMTTGAYLVIHGLTAPTAAGMFCGSLTNTPALAGVVEILKKSGLGEEITSQPVVGYSVVYPMGVVGMILMISIFHRLTKQRGTDIVDPEATEHALVGRTVQVTRPEATFKTVRELIEESHGHVVFGRVKHGSTTTLPRAERRLDVGDLVSMVGTHEELDRMTQYLGEPVDERLDYDRREMDHRVIFVSNAEVAGRRLADLQLPQRYGALVTRIRRGDHEFLASADTTIELGDRVLVLSQRDNLNSVCSYLGDSYRAVSEVDIGNFSLGLAIGLLIGAIKLPLPGGTKFELGIAGGPLVVAVILGYLKRTGPVVWNLPYSANLTLRQLGMALFLAGIGTRAGYAFAQAITQPIGAYLFISGALITCAVTGLALWIGHKLLKIPNGQLFGMMAGLQTQPAVLAFALQTTGDEEPNVGAARVYPVAMITKILVAQLLLSLLPLIR